MVATFFYICHAEGVEVQNVEVHFAQEDRRSGLILRDVTDFHLGQSNAATDAGIDYAGQGGLQQHAAVANLY